MHYRPDFPLLLSAVPHAIWLEANNNLMAGVGLNVGILLGEALNDRFDSSPQNSCRVSSAVISL